MNASWRTTSGGLFELICAVGAIVSIVVLRDSNERYAIALLFLAFGTGIGGFITGARANRVAREQASKKKP